MNDELTTTNGTQISDEFWTIFTNLLDASVLAANDLGDSLNADYGVGNIEFDDVKERELVLRRLEDAVRKAEQIRGSRGA